MEFKSRYTAHPTDEKGFVNYSSEENNVWQILYTRQKPILENRACQTFIDGLEKLHLTPDAVPQLPDVNQRLSKLTGWQVVPVNALISARHFFELLANQKFPAATFIRNMESLDYVQEPDIFHELFGHCPMLTDPVFADFVHAYAKLVLTFPESDWALLQRLFWFTVEFGLIQTQQGVRAYGGGILSSISETPYSVESHVPFRVLFDPIAAFRTPYRIDEPQKVYFVIPDFETLYQLIHRDLKQDIEEAKRLGELPAFFKVETGNPSIHIFAC